MKIRHKIVVALSIIIIVTSCKPKTESNNIQISESTEDIVDENISVSDITYSGDIEEPENEYVGNRNKYIMSALEQLGLELEDCAQQYVCEQVFPHSPNQSVVLIPKYATKEGDDFFILDIHIVVIDHDTEKIVHRFYEKDALTSDAIQLERISIVTTPYKVNKSTTAFGIEISYSGSSRPNPYSGTYLSLFVPRGENLIKILYHYPISNYSGEWDTMCAGTFASRKTSLEISEQQTKGYNNIIAHTSITTSVNTLVDGDCKAKESTENTTETIRFNGGVYEFDKEKYW